jgi:acetylornithine deacetylase/succinyl-diaminopimelate desuccinylase-like protein
MGSYIEFTGDVDAKTVSTLGSTYSKCMYEDGVCDFVGFGPYFDGSHLIHAANERIKISEVHTIYNIYHDAIKKLANMELPEVTNNMIKTL